MQIVAQQKKKCARIGPDGWRFVMKNIKKANKCFVCEKKFVTLHLKCE